MNTDKTFTNTMPWTNTQVRNNPFPLERYSIFGSYADAKEYALSSVLAYEGQIIAATNDGVQKVYVLDPSAPDNLRQLAAGDDASHLTELLNEEISSRISADQFLSNAILSETSAREADDLVLSNAISTEIDNRISAINSLSTAMTVTIDSSVAPSSDAILKSYSVKQGGVEIGKIDIPKDFLVKNAAISVVSADNVPYTGAKVGDKYIDLTINVKSGTAVTDEHLYIPIKDFFVAYSGAETPTATVTIGADNSISAVVNQNSIDTEHLVNGSVTNVKLADYAVTASKILSGAVTDVKLAANSVTNEKIADNAVGTDELSANAVTNAKIANDAVTASKIQNGAVTENKIENDAVTNAKIADNAVSTDQLSAGAVTAAKIAEGAVTTDKIGTNAITTEKLDSCSVTLGKLAGDVVDRIDQTAATAESNANAYTDGKISALDSSFAGTVSSTIISMTETDGIVTLSSAPIAIKASQVIDLSSTVGAYVPLSVASDNATSTNKLQTADEVQTAINTAISALDVSATTFANNQTIKSISEDDGKISVVTQNIVIDQTAVNGLTDLLFNIQDTLSDHQSSIDALSNIISNELSTNIATISSNVSAISSNLNTVSSDVSQLKTDTSTLSTKLNTVSADLDTLETKVSGIETSMSSYALSSDVNTLVTNLDNAKLDKTTFATISNDIGLSAASSANKVVTKNDIADLAGAMHFRGAVTPTEGQADVAAIEVYYTAQGYTKKAGDIVIITTNSKEYVYNGTDWIELGAEDLYATKAEVNTISTALSANDVYLSGQIDTKLAISDASNISATLTANDAYLSTAIDEKIVIDGTQTKSLSVVHLSQEDFYQRVQQSSLVSNEIYIVSSDYINAYGQQIKNVAAPTLSGDAATKNYVDSAIDALHGSSLSGVELNGQAFTVANNVASLNIDVISCGNATAAS